MRYEIFGLIHVAQYIDKWCDELCSTFGPHEVRYIFRKLSNHKFLKRNLLLVISYFVYVNLHSLIDKLKQEKAARYGG
jgi:hypothetical protein